MIEVGDKPVTFTAHESLLCARSEFFRTAMKKDWQEGQHKVVTLPYDSSGVVQLYLQTLCSGQAVFDGIPRPGRHSILISLYVLGERLLDYISQDQVITKIIAIYREFDAPENSSRLCEPAGQADINAGYEGTPPGSPLRRLLVNHYIARAANGQCLEDMDAAFAADIARELMQHVRMGAFAAGSFPDFERGSACRYHRHRLDESCGVQSQFGHHWIG